MYGHKKSIPNKRDAFQMMNMNKLDNSYVNCI